MSNHTHNSASDSDAGSGKHHWIAQRVTAIVLLPLSIWFLFTVIGLVGSSYEQAVMHFASSWRVSLMIIFVAVLFYHGYLGLQVVIEDYISDTAIRMWSITLVKCLAVLLAVTGIVSALRIGI